MKCVFGKKLQNQCISDEKAIISNNNSKSRGIASCLNCGLSLLTIIIVPGAGA